MDHWLINLTDLFPVDNWLDSLMDDILMMFMNYILMMLMKYVLMMLMNDVLVMLLIDWSVDVRLDSCGFSVTDNLLGTTLTMRLNSCLLVMSHDRSLFKCLLNDWLIKGRR